MFFNYPSISSLFKHLGMYVFINLYHWPHLAAVIVPMFLCRVWSSKWVRKLPNAIPCRHAFSLLFICSCCSGRLMCAFMAAFKALMACSTMLRNGLYGGSFLSSEFGPGKAAIKAESSFTLMKFMEVLMNVYLRYSFNCWRKWLYILRKWTAKGVLFRISKSAHHGIPPFFLLSQKFERLLVCQGN